MGFVFSSWFEACTLVLGLICGRMLFNGKWDIAFWLFIIWLFLFILETKLQEVKFEKWKREVFG